MNKQDFINIDWRLTKDRTVDFDMQYLERQDEGVFWDLTYDTEDNKIEIEEFYQSKLCAITSYTTKPDLYNSRTIFSGTINSLNEFKILMKQLGITK